MLSGIGLDPFDQYVLAHKYSLDDVADREQPAVIAGFEKFCETHITDLVEGSPNGGRAVLKLAQAWAKTRYVDVFRPFLARHKRHMEEVHSILYQNWDSSVPPASGRVCPIWIGN